MSHCKQCNADMYVTDSEGLCAKCQIGDGSPTLWLLGKLQEKLSKPAELWNKSSAERSCFMSITYNAKTGECTGTEKPSWKDMKDYITIGVTAVCDNDEKRSNTHLNIRCWIDAGNTIIHGPKALTITDFQNLVAEGAPYLTIAVANTISYLRENLYYCCGCEKDLPNPAAGRHFAESYCSPCWEKYKAANSRLCLKCHSPLSGCCC